MRKRFFEAHGLPCLVVWYDEPGHFCGYVGVPKSHPYFRKSYVQIEGMDDAPRVHGGLTYAGTRDDGRAEWWIGFDCAHAGDWLPYFPDNGSYHKWSEDEVADETRRLAEQLAEVTA